MATHTITSHNSLVTKHRVNTGKLITVVVFRMVVVVPCLVSVVQVFVRGVGGLLQDTFKNVYPVFVGLNGGVLYSELRGSRLVTRGVQADEEVGDLPVSSVAFKGDLRAFREGDLLSINPFPIVWVFKSPLYHGEVLTAGVVPLDVISEGDDQLEFRRKKGDGGETIQKGRATFILKQEILEVVCSFLKNQIQRLRVLKRKVSEVNSINIRFIKRNYGDILYLTFTIKLHILIIKAYFILKP